MIGTYIYAETFVAVLFFSISICVYMVAFMLHSDKHAFPFFFSSLDYVSYALPTTQEKKGRLGWFGFLLPVIGVYTVPVASDF